MSLREARDDDGDELIRLTVACWREYPGVIFDPTEHTELRAIATAYRQRGGACWVVERESHIIASVAIVPSRDNGAELEKLYVNPAERRHGLGARLCDHVEQHARECNAGFIELWTDTRFTSAHKLYQRLGYVRGPHTRELDDLSHSVEYYFRKDLPARGARTVGKKTARRLAASRGRRKKSAMKLATIMPRVCF